MRYIVSLLLLTAWLEVSCAEGVPDVVTVCGDSLVQGNETCDDGNADSVDGCDKDCIVESGYTCTGAPSVCVTLCGDGVIAGSEVCDGSELGGLTCEALALGTGTVNCDPSSCEIDTSGCSAVACGNGTIDAPEQCDGADMNDEACEGQGYDGGNLACTAACLLDTSGCTLHSCGNGIVESIEECDDANLDPGDGCGPNCAIEAGWNCVGQPSVCAELCGNSTLDAGEQCDGASLGGQTCESLGLGYVGGTLTCAVNCTFNIAACHLPSCGNGALDTGEQCDGVLLGGQTCDTVGAYIGGTLLCLPSCAFDLDGCIPIVCGDGVISSGEACDDGNTSGGDGCNLLCSVESGWSCTGEPSTCTPLCGNNQLDAGEDCDGGQLGSATCMSLGYDSGSLGCRANCTFNTSSCTMFSCGDGMVTGGEDCDGGDLNGATCQTQGFVSGQLACAGNCSFDTTGCVAPVCGDGIISVSIGEQCDDNDTSGGDGCNSVCQVENGWICTGEPSTCTPSCGNNTWDPGEACDGGDLNGGTCLTQGFPGGTLACTGACTYDTAGCLASVCPNGVREGSEACDGADFGGQTCASYGFSGGTLTCTSGCSIVTSGCSNTVCGNYVVESGEACDDGNTLGGDGCDASCQWEQTCTADQTISCGGSDHRETFQFAGNDASGYSCSNYGSDEEHIYAITVPAGTTNITANVTCDDPGSSDYDIFVMEGACNPGLCVSWGASGGVCDDTSFSVVAGRTYYIAVEVYSANDGFTLDVSCN